MISFTITNQQPLLQLATRMTTPLLGQLFPFKPEEETISTYLERTNIFFQANKIEDDKQKLKLFYFLTQLVQKHLCY